MAKRALIIVILIAAVSGLSNAQEQLQHPKKVYVCPLGKIYFNKSMPVYFRVSASPDANAPSYLLHSETMPQYSNPMYFDSEGRNTLRSPSAVDTLTKKIAEPRRDVLFDVFADGLAPVSSASVLSVQKHMLPSTTYYGKDTRLKIAVTDAVSGVEASYMSVNGKSFDVFSEKNNFFNEEGNYTVKYYSVDNVGNAEPVKSLQFSVDLSAPVTTLSIVGESKGKVLSSKAAVSLTARDTLSGVSRIMYSVNDGPEKVYSAPLPLSLFNNGQTKISYYAVDRVGNREEARVISTTTEKPEEQNTYSFYIDKEAPEVSFEIAGDHHQAKNLFISGRSRFQINAADEKSGVEKVTYAINKPVPGLTYSEPFEIAGEGLQYISYGASDYVGNIALAKTQQVVVDRTAPRTAISFSGKQFHNRDTLFITGETMLVLSVSENGSGIQHTIYKIDGGSGQAYSAPFPVTESGYHTLEFFSADNVNNAEPARKSSFFVDNKGPAIHCNFSVKAIGEKTVRDEKYTIYPSNVMLYIAATDNASGGERIEYRINGKPAQNILPVKGFAPGNYEIEIVASDVLRNRTTEIIRFSVED